MYKQTNTICKPTHIRLFALTINCTILSNGNKFPVFPECIYNKWQNMMYQTSQAHNHGKIWKQWERWILPIWCKSGGTTGWGLSCYHYLLYMYHKACINLGILLRVCFHDTWPPKSVILWQTSKTVLIFFRPSLHIRVRWWWPNLKLQTFLIYE